MNQADSTNQSLSAPSNGGAGWRRYAPPLAIVALGIAAYANSFSGAFLFDDATAIQDNPNILSLWPISTALTGPEQSSVAGRPLVNLSFAINYALGGFDPWGYHALNLMIHLGAALLLYGAVRRTLLLPRFRNSCGGSATRLALAISLVWLVHPLQTESVTYIVQRSESLMGIFQLATLYCFIRHLESPRPKMWLACSVLLCAAGMGTKEVMATAPAVVLLYDFTLVATGWREWIRRRWGYYLGLGAGWVILAALVIPGPRSFSAGFGFKDVTPLDYARTQFEVLTHYLRLVFWPHPLVLDYMWPAQKSWASAAPYVLLVSLLAAASIYFLIRRSWIGFLGGAFFIVLAPTSSFVPIADLAFEHRMYLPLASVVALAIFMGRSIFGRLADRCKLPPARQRAVLGVLVGAMVAALAAVTIRRNWDYRTELAMNEDSVRKRPENHRAHCNLAFTLIQMGNYEEAEGHLRKALAIHRKYPQALYNLGIALANTGRLEEARENYLAAIAIDPNYAEAYNNLASALMEMGRLDEARENIEKALVLWPDDADAHSNLGMVLTRQGKLGEASQHYRMAAELYAGAIRANPKSVRLRHNLAVALTRLGERDEALKQLKAAVELNPLDADSMTNFGVALQEGGNLEAAEEQFRRALELNPDHAEALNYLGDLLAGKGNAQEGMEHLIKAVQIKPAYPEAHNNLGTVLADLGRLEEAMDHLRRAIELKPGYAHAHNNLGTVLAQLGDKEGAIREFSIALQIDPDYASARANLDLAQKAQ